MLQFDVALCRARDNVAHLSALVTRQAGKVRRYKSEVASGFMPDVPEFVPAGESLSQRVVHAGFWVFALRIIS